MRTYTVEVQIISDKNSGVYVNVVGPGGKPWFTFHISPATIHMGIRALTIFTPFMKRIKKEMKNG